MPGETIRFDIDPMGATKVEFLLNSGASVEEVTEAINNTIIFSVKDPDSEEFVPQKITFNRLYKESNTYIDLNKYKDFEYELGEDEYWVMGDNYCSSFDCFSPDNKSPIYYDNIVGVLIAIEGTCKIVDKFTNHARSADDDGTSEHYFECKDRKRHLPVYYI